MTIDLTWKGNMAFESSTPSGAKFVIDTYVDQGGDESGPTPVETLVSALGACTAMDVVSILKKMRQPVESYRVEVTWERGPKGVWPRPVTKVEVRHIVSGEGLDPAAVEKAVRLSDEKYCSVSATLRSGPEIVTSVEVG
ncbi:MAG TPA: OsmC family protein [Fimbriimonadaceae bacterium]|nr:OsmC family protein [Fimbriimonadaceae bacterium]